MAPGKLPQLPLPGAEAIKVGQKYVILTVEEFVSELQNFEGWRVTLDGGKDNLLAIPLWYGETVSRTSKLGSFVDKLGNDYDKWIGKIIKFVKWSPKDNEITIVEE